MLRNVEAENMALEVIDQAEPALLLGLGCFSFAYGVVQWTGSVTYTPPAIVYFIAGIVALLWAVSLNRRS
jgi:hypothetical protein